MESLKISMSLFTRRSIQAPPHTGREKIKLYCWNICLRWLIATHVVTVRIDTGDSSFFFWLVSSRVRTISCSIKCSIQKPYYITLYNLVKTQAYTLFYKTNFLLHFLFKSSNSFPSINVLLLDPADLLSDRTLNHTTIAILYSPPRRTQRSHPPNWTHLDNL